MLSGKQYKRAVRGLTLVYEAMMRCLMTYFFKWCEQETHIICGELWTQLLDVQISMDNHTNIHEAVLELNKTFTIKLKPLFNVSIREGCIKSLKFR